MDLNEESVLHLCLKLSLKLTQNLSQFSQLIEFKQNICLKNKILKTSFLLINNICEEKRDLNVFNKYENYININNCIEMNKIVVKNVIKSAIHWIISCKPQLCISQGRVGE